MRSKVLKKILALALATISIVSCLAVSAFAGTGTGTSSTFGNWISGTELITNNDGSKSYYSRTICEVPAKLTVESEYQSYPSGVRYDYKTSTSEGYNAVAAFIKYPKSQQSTVWSYHNWKSSSGTGMTKYSQLINA